MSIRDMHTNTAWTTITPATINDNVKNAMVRSLKANIVLLNLMVPLELSTITLTGTPAFTLPSANLTLIQQKTKSKKVSKSFVFSRNVELNKNHYF